jgi:hypothetical protein
MASLQGEYSAMVARLTFNSHPIIHELTSFARANGQPPHVETIVLVVERAIADESNPERVLCLFYLLDSIIKNVGGAYKLQFGRNIVQLFCRKYSDPNKPQMEKLLATWLNFFGEKTVAEIRARLRLPFVPPPPPKPKPKPAPPNHATETVKKLLREYRLHIEANRDNPTFDAETLMATLRQFRHEHSAEDPVLTQELNQLDDMLHRIHIRNKIRKPPAQPQLSPYPPAEPMPWGPVHAGPMPPPPPRLYPYVDPRAGSPAPVNFNHPELLILRHERVIDALYDASSLQCTDTGLRFADRDALQKHKDDLFNENEKKKSSNSSRLWFITETEWIQWTGGLKESLPPPFFGGDAAKNGVLGDAAESAAEREDELAFRIAVREVDGEDASQCAACREELKQIYDQEKEAWMFVGVCRRGDGSVVHRSCADEGDSRAPKKQKL